MAMDLAKHLAEDHRFSPISVYMREIVYGGLDGIITTFAVVAGFTGALQPELVTLVTPVPVLLFGLANLFADGLSMGLSNFLSLRSEKGVYRAQKAKEHSEIHTNPRSELEETIAILREKGYSPRDAMAMAKLYAKNKTYWADFMMNHELQISNPERKSSLRTSVATFCAFLLFGLIPLLPYIFAPTSASSFVYSISFSAIALLLLGLLRWRVIKDQLIRSLGETFFLGSVAAAAAYLVGTFFRT